MFFESDNKKFGRLTGVCLMGIWASVTRAAEQVWTPGAPPAAVLRHIEKLRSESRCLLSDDLRPLTLEESGLKFSEILRDWLAGVEEASPRSVKGEQFLAKTRNLLKGVSNGGPPAEGFPEP